MLEVLLYTSLSCQQADALMIRVNAYENMSDAIKIELVETIQEATPECIWDAND